jgi:hypothetical protein
VASFEACLIQGRVDRWATERAVLHGSVDSVRVPALGRCQALGPLSGSSPHALPAALHGSCRQCCNLHRRCAIPLLQWGPLEASAPLLAGQATGVSSSIAPGGA